MPTLIVTATHPTYNGTTFGVRFEEGRAVLNEHSNPNRLGYSLEELAKKFQTDLPGYTVEFIGDEQHPDPIANPANASNEAPQLAPKSRPISRKKTAKTLRPFGKLTAQDSSVTG